MAMLSFKCVLVLIELNKNDLFHRFFSSRSLVFSEICESFWVNWFFVIVKGAQALDQTDLGSNINFDFSDHMTSDKYLISQSLLFVHLKTGDNMYVAEYCKV